VGAWRNTAPENVWKKARRQKSTELPASFTFDPSSYLAPNPEVLNKPALSIFTVSKT
jgi:hypothetical protein